MGGGGRSAMRGLCRFCFVVLVDWRDAGKVECSGEQEERMEEEREEQRGRDVR